MKSQNRTETSDAADPSAMKTIFFDAAGTLIYLPKSVGQHYAFVGEKIGLELDARALDGAFAACWKEAPVRIATDGPREDDLEHRAVSGRVHR